MFMQLHRSNNLLYRKAFWPWKDLLIFFTSAKSTYQLDQFVGGPSMLTLGTLIVLP